SGSTTSTKNPGATGSTAPAPGQQGVAKDGSTMPLANAPGGGDKSLATSKQDAQSQQRGGQTAASAGQSQNAASGSGYHSPEMMAALDKARSLQAQGNEAGC